MILVDNFYPFIGVIEGIDDPEQIGRVQVRVYGYHSDDKSFLPSEMLQWFSCVQNNSAGTSGIGQSPTGYVKGSTVFGYFLNAECQDGIVIGSILGKPSADTLNQMGFSDPDGVYPLYTDDSDVNKLARGQKDHPVFQIRKSKRVVGIKTADGSTWDEPAYENNAKYPDNDVLETKGGHVREYDNTKGNERIHEMHKSGTYYEINKDGNRVVKIVGDGYEIIAGNKFANVRGNVNLTVEGDVKHYVMGNYTMKIDNVISTEAQSIEEEAESKTTKADSITEESNSRTTKSSNWVHTGQVFVNGTFTVNGTVLCSSLIEG